MSYEKDIDKLSEGLPSSPGPQHNCDCKWDKEKSNLYQHAKRELQLAGLFDKDSDYGGMVGNAVLRMIELFACEGHSGFSAQMCRRLFADLSAFKQLTPITDNPDDWMNVDEHLPGTWQCKRNGALFSTDHGKTYYNLDEKRRKFLMFTLPKKIHRSEKHGH